MSVTDFLETKGCWFERVPHMATYSAQRLAHELHAPGHEVAKTVLLRADGDYVYIVAIVPADKRIDLDRVSQAFGGCEIALATEREISEHCPDCEFGVLPPFGSSYGMKTVVDASLADNDEIVFEGGSHQEAIRMRFDEFRHVESPIVASIAK